MPWFCLLCLLNVYTIKKCNETPANIPFHWAVIKSNYKRNSSGFYKA